MQGVNFIMQHSLSNSRRSQQLSESQIRQRIQLVTIDKKYSLLTPISQRQVSVQLKTQLDYLLGRKEKEHEKKQKVRQLEEVYERERASRISKLNSKLARSDSNRSQRLSQKLQQTKLSNDHFDKVTQKKMHQNEEEIQKMLKLRKDYSNKSHSTNSRNSLTQNNTQRNLHSNSRNLASSNKDIDCAIRQIESRIDNAKTKNRFYKQQIAEKARGYSRNYDQIMEKIRTRSVLDETSCFQEYYHRATHILACKEKSRSFYEQQSERKRKIIDDKFKKCTANLQVLDQQRERKYDEMRSKFDKTTLSKEWRNEKNGVYLQRFVENQKDLERQKLSKAEVILKKHLEAKLKNRALKEQKDRILQTLKKVEP